MPKIVEVIKGDPRIKFDEYDREETLRVVSELFVGLEPGYYMLISVPFRVGRKKRKIRKCTDILWIVQLIGKWKDEWKDVVIRDLKKDYGKCWILLKVWKSRRGRKVRL